jgi:hypothetical protein
MSTLGTSCSSYKLDAARFSTCIKEKRIASAMDASTELLGLCLWYCALSSYLMESALAERCRRAMSTAAMVWRVDGGVSMQKR